MMDIYSLILTAFATIVTLTLHEYSHGYMAYRLGDPTARNLGRLTMNPIKHIDPIGAFCMLFFHVGWAKPVPINPRNFNNPKRDFALTALAGPVSNLILATVSALIFQSTLVLYYNAHLPSGFTASLLETLLSFFYILHLINIGIAVFNLIPIPPLDGSRIINALLPDRIYYKIMKHERTIFYVLLGWLVIGDAAVTYLLKIPTIAANGVLSTVIRYMSLSELLDVLIEAISGLIFKMWRLIPFLNI